MKLHLPKMLAAAVLAAFISLTQASGTALTDAALSLPDFAQTTLSGATGWTFTNITPSGNTYTSTGTQGSITHDTDWAVLEGNRNKWSGIIQVDAQSLLNVATSGSGILLQQTNANLGGVGYNNGKETGAWTGSAYPSLTLNDKTLAQCKDGAGNLTLGVITMGGGGTAIYIVDGQKNVYSATLDTLRGTSSSANIGMILTGASGVTYKQLYLFGTQVSGTDMTSMLQELAVQAEANEFVWAGTGTSAVWDTTTQNWTKGGTPATYISDYATTAIFDATASAKEAKVNSDIIAADVTVSDNYTFTVGGTSTLSIANLNVASGNKLTIGGTGTVNAGNLTGTGIIHLNEGSHFAMSTLTADNQVVSLPFEGNGTLEFETVTVKNTNGSVTFGVPTDNGSVQMTGGVVTYSGGVKHELDQLGLSYNGGQNSTVNVETDTTLHVVGKNVGYDNASRMAASMFLGHWNAQNTINVRGTLIAEAALTTWDGKVDINVEDGGRLELRDGLNRNKSRENAININVVSGGVVMAGTTHNTEHTVSHDSLSVNLSDGAIFRSYYGEGETTANLGGKLNFTDGTATLDVGDATRTTTIGGTLAGEGAINKTGKGILVISGGHKTLGDTINLTEGTLTFNSDVVLDISNLSYDTQGDSLVYKLVNISEGATYTGWDSLTKNSLAGVMANSVEFKADGTVVLTTEKPHTVTWDPNWKLSTGPDVLSASLTESTALITSPYKSGTDVAVELTGTGNADAYIYGVQNSDVDSTGKTYETNVWINAKEGSYKAIVGGSLCNNWGSGGALNLKGDTHIQVEGATVGTIVGGNLKDGQSPQFTGSSYISVISGDVTAAIIGSSTNSHNASTTQTGDTNIFVYVPLANTSNPLPQGGGGSNPPGNHVIGGAAHVDNSSVTSTLDGSTHVTIDLTKYSGGGTTFVKTIVGGHGSLFSTHNQIISGSTEVVVKGAGVEFSGDIIAGSLDNEGSSAIDGGTTLSIENGTYSGAIIGGTKVTAGAASAIGEVVVNLGGTAQINGGVYAAGWIDGTGTGESSVTSATVNVGADVTFGSVTLSGGFGGASATRGSVTNGSVLNLTEGKAYTGLATATLDAFDEISVAKDGSATVSAITNTPWLTKSGDGALTLALDGEFAIMNVNVGAGTLTLGAADMEIMGIAVDKGATLAAAAGSSLQVAGITLSGGSTLAVGTEGLVLGDGSYLTMNNGKVNISTTGTLGQEVILITGLTEEDSITGINFNKTDKSGNKYADSSDYLTLGTGLADYTQLKLKDGKLILTKAAGEGSYWGAGIGGGTWDMASNNWADDDNQAPTRAFTDSNAAHFTAAGLGGAINVTTTINVTTINVSGAAYNFTGGQNLTITNGISVTDSGVATFDKVTSELKNVNIAGTDSKLSITTGDVTVDAFANEGTFNAGGNLTIKSAVTAGGNVAADGNVALASGTDNVFGSLNATGAVTGASKLTVGGASAIDSVEGIGTLALNGGTLSLGTASGLANTQLGGALSLTGETVNLGAVTMADGSSISSSKVVVANGITVSGTGTVKGGATLQTASVGGTGTLAVENGTVGIASGSTMTVSGVLDVKSGAHISNSGTLAVTNSGRVIAGNGVSLGTVDAKGAIELDGAAVSATGGSIAALDMGSGETLTVANDLALTSTTGGNGGSLTVGGALTVGGEATIGNVTAGTLELTTAGTLTASGTLETGSITLSRVGKTDCYISANNLAADSLNFVVEEKLITSQGFEVGTVITLADLATDFAGSVTINGKSSFTDDNRRVYTIAKNSGDHDIVLTVEPQESGFVWTGNEDTLWSTNDNWSGGTVPGSGDWVQVMNDTHPHDIELDGDAEVSYFSVSATDATLRGNHTLEVGSALEVNVNGILNVGDGSTETMVSAPEVQVTGELNVQTNAFVDAKHTTIKGGVLNVADGGSYFTGVVDMTEGGSLYAEGEASIAAEQLNGDSDSTVGGNVTIYGNGGRYTGEYDDAYIEVVEDADATFYAGKGLNLHGDGTAKLQYSGDTAIGGVDAGDLDIILNDPTSSNIGSTLTLQNPSAMEAGSITFGMSAVQSAKTLGIGAPVILEGDLVLGDEATVVVNQDKTQDTGIVMAVGNNGKTRNLVLARVGAVNTNTDSVVLNGNLYGKYFKNARIEHGALLVDMNDTYYQTISGATSFNGRAGAGMLDDAFVENNPQISNPTGDLAAVMTALEQGAISSQEADRVLSAMSGASHAAMGAAWSRDVDRQLRAIRNRTTSMGVAECVVNEDMPFINVWINAEGDYTKLNNDGTLAGYKLSSWGGTVGVDVDFTNRFTMGLAVTAMSGDFTACSADNAEGDLDRLYVSVFGRYTHRAWTHTLVGTFGMADTDLKRTVDYGTGRYTTNSSSDGTAFGLMYEVGYTVALNENATTCLQPVLNLSYRHSSLDGCSESGTDAALRGGDVDMDVFTIALGARLQSVVGTSVYNRSSIFEGRVLCKLDSGDREASMQSSFVNVGGKREVRSSEMGAFGLELGAGLVVPIAENGGSIFFDVSAEIRDKYTEVNGTVGYRYNF